MDIVELVRTRYTTKHYDPARRISDRDIADLMEVLRLSPSSVNSQPWHFFVTGTDEGKARVMPAVLDFIRPRVADASHLVVFAVPVEFTEERFRRLVAQELAQDRPVGSQKAVGQLGKAAVEVGLGKAAHVGGEGRHPVEQVPLQKAPLGLEELHGAVLVTGPEGRSGTVA